MKWKTLCLSAALTAALTAVPAYALDYTVDAPEDHLFGRPTSVETAADTKPDARRAEWRPAQFCRRDWYGVLP